MTPNAAQRDVFIEQLFALLCEAAFECFGVGLKREKVLARIRAAFVELCQLGFDGVVTAFGGGLEQFEFECGRHLVGEQFIEPRCEDFVCSGFLQIAQRNEGALLLAHAALGQSGFEFGGGASRFDLGGQPGGGAADGGILGFAAIRDGVREFGGFDLTQRPESRRAGVPGFFVLEDRKQGGTGGFQLQLAGGGDGFVADQSAAVSQNGIDFGAERCGGSGCVALGDGSPQAGDAIATGGVLPAGEQVQRLAPCEFGLFVVGCHKGEGIGLGQAEVCV